jgi:nucleoid-associated protein YejK
MTIGRPTNLTPELHAKIVNAIAKGNRGEAAAEAYGVADSTFYQWLAKGRAGEQPYADFSDAVTQARGQAELDAVGALRDGMAMDAKFAVEWLKRARHKSWSEKQEIDMRVGPFENLSDEEIARQHAEMVARVTGKAEE